MSAVPVSVTEPAARPFAAEREPVLAAGAQSLAFPAAARISSPAAGSTSAVERAAWIHDGEHSAVTPGVEHAALTHSAEHAALTSGVERAALASGAERAALIARLRAAIGLRDPSVAPGQSARLPGRLSTGFAVLDDALGGGLCAAALNEIHVAAAGSGALEALLPCLARAGRDDSSSARTVLDASAGSASSGRKHRLLAWIHPGRTPYPPTLVQQGFDLRRWLIVRPPDEDGHLWALDQALRSAACDAVVAFAGDVPDRMMRRLQLAAEEGSTLALLIRPAALAPRPSPSALRLLVEPVPTQDLRRRRIRVTILKARGLAVPPAAPVEVEWSRDLLAPLSGRTHAPS